MAFPPKKKGMDVMVAVGPHKPGLGAPMPVEKSKGGIGDEGSAPPEMDEESPEHEASETPEQEGQEDYGAKLVADIDAVGKKYGADPETTRSIAADFFEAISKCLRGGGEEEAPGAEMPPESGDQGQGGY